jgi:HsdM N-terminal domain
LIVAGNIQIRVFGLRLVSDLILNSLNPVALKKSELYSSLWSDCDELRGGMDASQYNDYVLVVLFIKYVSDKYAGLPFAKLLRETRLLGEAMCRVGFASLYPTIFTIDVYGCWVEARNPNYTIAILNQLSI